MTQYVTTEKSIALRFQIEYEFGNFCLPVEGKTGEPGEKHLGAWTRTSNKLDPHNAKSENRARATMLGGECTK